MRTYKRMSSLIWFPINAFVCPCLFPMFFHALFHWESWISSALLWGVVGKVKTSRSFGTFSFICITNIPVMQFSILFQNPFLPFLLRFSLYHSALTKDTEYIQAQEYSMWTHTHKSGWGNYYEGFVPVVTETEKVHVLLSVRWRLRTGSQRCNPTSTLQGLGTMGASAVSFGLSLKTWESRSRYLSSAQSKLNAPFLWLFVIFRPSVK